VDSVAALDAKIRLVRRHLPANISELYALPREGSGSVLEWWTELGGQATPFTRLNSDQQTQLLAQWHQHQKTIRHLADELQRGGNAHAADSLRSLLGYPDPQHVYSINGTPLVVRWDSLESRPLTPATALAVPMEVAESSTRRRRPWLLASLLLLGLVSLLAWWCWRPHAKPLDTVASEISEPLHEEIPESRPPTIAEPIVVPPVVGVENQKDCRAPEPDKKPPQFVVVLDTSGSMDLNINTVHEQDEWYGRVGATLDPSDPRVARLMSKPSRLDVAKHSLARMVDNLQPQIDTRFMAFAGCNSVVDYGLFAQSKRAGLIRGINGLKAAGGTPLAASLAKAASTVDGRNRDAVVVMFIDGIDNCQQDACAVSREIAQRQPRLKVNVVNIGQNALSNCMAENTGGRVYVSSDAAKLRDMLQQASQEVSKVAGCP
jgi:hypothetical protein